MRTIYLLSILTTLFSTSSFAETEKDFCYNTPFKVSFTTSSYIYNSSVKIHTMNERNKIIKAKREACEYNSGRLSVIKRYTTLQRISGNYNQVTSSAIISCNLRKN